MKYLTMIAAAAVMTASAWATPVTTPPPVITALGGNVTAVYVFANAADTSLLSLMSAPTQSNFFCNHTFGTCTASATGQVQNLGNRSGVLDFTLANKTTGFTYDTLNPDGAGDYHAKITTNYASFGVGALPSAAAAVIAGLTNVTYVAFEDRQMSNGSDFDYNDLIFAFSNTAPSGNPGVPEPLTLSLMGAGLLGAFGLRRAKKTKA